MADVTFDGVRRPRGLRILPIAILAAVLLLGLIAFFVLRGDRTRMQLDSPREGATQAGYAGAITDVAPLVAVGDKSILAGREVAFENVQVLQVLGPRTFLIGPSMSQKAAIIWQPEANADSTTPPPKIDAGDTVAIHGVVEEMPSSQLTLSDLRLAQLAPADRAAMQVVVKASTVVETADRGGSQ